MGEICLRKDRSHDLKGCPPGAPLSVLSKAPETTLPFLLKFELVLERPDVRNSFSESTVSRKYISSNNASGLGLQMLFHHFKDGRGYVHRKMCPFWFETKRKKISVRNLAGRTWAIGDAFDKAQGV